MGNSISIIGHVESPVVSIDHNTKIIQAFNNLQNNYHDLDFPFKREYFSLPTKQYDCAVFGCNVYIKGHQEDWDYVKSKLIKLVQRFQFFGFSLYVDIEGGEKYHIDFFPKDIKKDINDWEYAFEIKSFKIDYQLVEQSQ